ncbi:organic cation transporter protein-like [Epargyreus clarus]|uniref:organic cation transporter protein-like n=1 Tax=Epargyreus clarus TaxID=520877 RepID=UPI003C30DEB7
MKQDDRDSERHYEDVLNSQIGQFGKYQAINLFLLIFPAMFSGFMAGDYIFTAGKLPLRCAIPQCDGPNPEYSPEWVLNAIPATSTGFDECRRYANATTDEQFTSGVCPASLFDRNTTIGCESYVYERINTVVYDFGLECQEWRRALAGTLNSLGGMFSLPLAGFVSDVFGRRISIVFFAFNCALVGFIRAFSVNYAMYVAMQFMNTAIGGGMYSAAYILATEMVGPKFRVPTSATMSSMFAMGQALLGAIAWGVHEWRTLTLTLFTPIFLLVSYYWLVTESHRWLLSKNKNEEAKRTIERACYLNGKPCSEDTMNYLLTAIPPQNRDDGGNKLYLLSRVLQSRVLLRRCCTTPVLWITTTFIYYGLSINSVSLSGNIYLNYMLIALVEIPGYFTAVLILDRVGRKITLFLGYFICSLCCIGFAFTPKNLYGVSLFLYLTGKFCTGVIFTSLYLFTLELYPTRYRHSFLGFSSMLGRVGSVVAPLTPPLMDYWRGIPSMMFGGMSMISAFLVLTQPETRGLKVPDTIEDAEQLGQ